MLSFKVLTVLSCLLCVIQATWYPNTFYMEDYCSQLLRVSGDAVIKVSRYSQLQRMSCSVTLLSSRGLSLAVTFRNYYMNPSYTNFFNCPYESIQLSTSGDPFILGQNGYCKSYRPSGQYFLSNQGAVSYSASSSRLYAPTVEILVSELSYSNSTGFCPGGSYDCLYKSQCVDYSLTCNGYNDCGSGRDEYDGCGGIIISVSAIGGIAAAAFFLFIFFVILSVTCYRRRQVRLAYVQYN